MNTITVEFFRAVADFKGDFYDTQWNDWSKMEERAQIRALLEQAEMPVGFCNLLRVAEEPEFLEFDSSDRSDACGYFEVKLSGPPWLLHSLQFMLEDDAKPVDPALPKRRYVTLRMMRRSGVCNEWRALFRSRFGKRVAVSESLIYALMGSRFSERFEWLRGILPSNSMERYWEAFREARDEAINWMVDNRQRPFDSIEIENLQRGLAFVRTLYALPIQDFRERDQKEIEP